jgi:hypothetical protein
VSLLDLMRRLRQLDHPERMRALIELARGLPPAEVDSLVRQLGEGDAYRRWLGLQVVALRRDEGAAWAALDDPSLLVRSLAAKLVGRLASEVPASALDRLDALTLSRLLREIVRRRRVPLAEALTLALLERGRLREAAMLLPSCSDGFVEARLDQAAWPEVVWKRLAARRPALLAARLERAFAAAERPELVWRRHPPALWAELCERAPLEVAGWVDRYAEADALPRELTQGAGLARLARRAPARMLGWLSTRLPWLTRAGLPAGLAGRARELDDDALAPLCRGLAQQSPAMLAALLGKLPYPRRARLFERATAELDTTLVEWPTELLAVLPTRLRDREAARLLGLLRARTDGSWRRELLGLRAIDAARAELEREGQSAQASERGEAHAALVQASMRSGEGMPQTLAWLKRLRNEQDPVRAAALGALARVPGRHFSDPAALDDVLSPIFEARDTSWATRQHVARVAHQLLSSRATEPTSPMFRLGLDLLERLAGHAGTPDLPRLDRNLPRGAERAIVAALGPWLEAARSRQQDRHLLRLWSALGKRAFRVAELAALVRDTIWHGHKDSAASAAALWLQDPKTRDPRVLELVARDRSALYLEPVLQHCHRRRQTLLPARLAPEAPRGRFHDGKVARVPHLVGGFQRWPTELQVAYVELVRLAETEPLQFRQTQAALVSLRARVPVTTALDLADALASSDVAVQEAALEALVWLDEPAPALPILFEHLDGDRARVAMYALPRLARLVPRERLVDALSELLSRPRLKVTVHKEALRLLGELGTPRAIELLRQSWQRPLHRDVRVAALHAARANLGEPAAWSLLEAAARDASPDVARAVVEISLGDVAEAHRARYLAVMAAVAEHGDPAAREALFEALARGWSLVDPVLVARLSARVLARLDPLEPWASVAKVLAEAGRSRAAHQPIIELVEALAAAADEAVAPAGELDRLAHRRLAGVLEALRGDRHPSAAALLDGLAERLLARPGWWPEGARLRVASAPSPGLGAVLLSLFASAPTPWCARVVEAAARAEAALPARAWELEAALRCAVELAEGPPAARVAAAAWVAELGPRWGWSAPWPSLLGRLREDHELDVRTSAREVWLTHA